MHKRVELEFGIMQEFIFKVCFKSTGLNHQEATNLNDMAKGKIMGDVKRNKMKLGHPIAVFLNL
jgi:hypothetical protein